MLSSVTVVFNVELPENKAKMFMEDFLGYMQEEEHDMGGGKGGYIRNVYVVEAVQHKD